MSVQAATECCHQRAGAGADLIRQASGHQDHQRCQAQRSCERAQAEGVCSLQAPFFLATLHYTKHRRQSSLGRSMQMHVIHALFVTAARHCSLVSKGWHRWCLLSCLPSSRFFPAGATFLLRPCSRAISNLRLLCAFCCRADVVLVGNEVDIVEEVKKTTGASSAISPAESTYMLSTCLTAFSSHALYI